MVLRALVLGLAVLAAQAAEDPWEKVLLLQKVKRHVAEAVQQLPDYTCLQTSARFRKKSEAEADSRLTSIAAVQTPIHRAATATPPARISCFLVVRTKAFMAPPERTYRCRSGNSSTRE